MNLLKGITVDAGNSLVERLFVALFGFLMFAQTAAPGITVEVTGIL